MSTIGKRLKTLRENRGLSVKEVADAVNVPVTTYREWENGRSISGEPYVELANYFQISLTELLTGEDVNSREVLRKLQAVELSVSELKKYLYSLI